MRRWSSRDLRYLHEHSHEGVIAVAHALGRSVRSVRIKASREGISLRQGYFCPHCLKWSYKELNKRTGWCQACTKAQNRKRVEAEIDEEARRVVAEKRGLQAAYSRRNRMRNETKNETRPEQGKRESIRRSTQKQHRNGEESDQ